MSDYRERFFDGVKEHSQIKLRAFDRYLVPWATKVGSRREVKRLWIVDGFAGAGRYESGELGSAGLALDKARSLLQRSGDGRRKVSIFFTERDRANFRRLKRLRSQYPEVEGFVENWDFWLKWQLIAEVVRQDPVLLFVDPFGLGDLKFDALVALCQALPTVDVMVNFASPAAKRLARGLPKLVDEAVGGDGWTLDSLSDVFSDRLRKRCGLFEPARLPVLGQIGDLKYELIMGARSHAAYDLWNDEIADRDRALLDSGTPEQVAARVDEAASILREVAWPMTHFSRKTLLTNVRTRRCGDVHTRVYLRAVAELVDSGVWSRGPGSIDKAPMQWQKR